MASKRTDPFGARLRTLRKAAHMTQQQVADALRVHRTSYTKYETEGVTPDHQGLVALAQLFGVTVDYLVGREETDRTQLANNSGGSEPLSNQELILVQMFRQLEYEEQIRLVEQVHQAFRQRRLDE